MKRLVLVLLLGCNDPRPVHRLDPHLNRMLDQPRGEAYAETPAFADGRVMRDPPRGTVQYARTASTRPAVTRALLAQGRERFETICATCHGIAGEGVSVVAEKMQDRRPPSFVEARLLKLSDDELYQVMTQGYGLMPGYATELEPSDRWAVVSYVRALQKSRRTRVADLSPELRARVEKEAR